MTDPLLRIIRAAERDRLFRRVSRVVVGMSGGADSLACLLVLLQLRERFGFEVAAAHFDHQLRPDSADDLAFVREVCANLGVNCISGEGDVGAAARGQGISIEAMGRQARYEFLAFAAGKERAEAVATGHTATDQAETILQHVVRGTGIRGLRGMLPVSAVPGATALRLVRPLLPIAREDTEAICKVAGITPRDDTSNENRSFQRNRIRHEVMPALRDLNPNVEDALIGLAGSARELFAPVEAQANSVQPLSRGPEGVIFALDALRNLPTEALTLLIERETSFTRTAFEVNRTRLENLRQVLASGSGEVAFGETVVEAASGRVRMGGEMPRAEQFDRKMVNIPGVTVAGLWRVEASTDTLAEEPGTQVVAIDASRLDGVLRVGPLEPNVRIPYHGQHRRLRSALQTEKVPRWERDFTLALSDRSGVVALVGAASRLLPAPTEAADPLFIRVRRT